MKYASVCDGIGAVHVAWQPLGWRCEWTAEIDAFPSAVVEQRWGFPNRGDMTKFNEWSDDGSSIDLLVGGTPCQSFSVAGLRKGLHDPRGGLMLTFLEIAQRHQPRWLVWENVPGVLSSNGGRDFGAFLGALGELGYGWAYRVLDAQWFGVAQRRRRVFVVGCLGDERRAAAVLFESESVCRDNPPSREKGEASAAGFATCPGVGGIAKPLGSHSLSKGRGTDLDNTTYVAFAQNQREEVRELGDVATALQVQGTHQQTFLATPFTKSKRAQSATDDESWVPGEVSPTMSCFDQGDTRATTVVAYDITGTLATNGAKKTDVHTALRSRAPGQSEASTTTVVAIQERAICENPDAGPDGVGVRADGVSYTLEARTVPQAVAFANRTRDGIKVPEVMKDGVVPALLNPGGGGRSDAVNVACGMAVRRLTPRECERLQGFPDDYTAIEYRKKPAADGPRYKALGNSMAVPVMRWIGERIDAIDKGSNP
jgi:DNA (cytosine-5)-methyltransferase 1